MTRRVLYTSADSGMPFWEAHTKPFVEAYAARVGAELVVLPKSKRKNPQLVLFDAMEASLAVGDSASVFVWMDADIVMTDFAPDLFACPDRMLYCAPDPPSRVHPRWLTEFKRFGVLNARPYPVTAIVRWSHRFARPIVDWVNKNQAKLPARMDDQSVSALACWETGVAVNFFPQWWHSMSRWVGPYTQFFHAAGDKKNRKLTGLKRIVARRNASGPSFPPDA